MYQAPRGTQDILPDEQPYWNYVKSNARQVAHLYGYGAIETPIFEDTQLFLRSVGETSDIVQKEMYTFLDKGENSLTLRPEGTAPIGRAYLEHGLSNQPQPVKLYTIGPFFRYDRPQAGRYRELHQFSYEAIGEIDPALDAEIIAMSWDYLTRLGLRELSIQLNSIGCPICRPHYVEALREYYRGKVAELCLDCQTRLERNPLRLLDCKNRACNAVAESAPRSIDYLGEECSGHFQRLEELLHSLAIPYQINNRLVRGLDYYTKTVFEVYSTETGSQSSLGGGGRYDGLIEQLGGRPTPAVGFAAGLERTILNLKKQGITPPSRPGVVAFVASLGDGTEVAVSRLVAQLRAADIAALQSFGRRSLKSQLKHAHASGARFTLILGPDELATGRVVLRDMEKSTQEAVDQSTVVELLLKGVRGPTPNP
ncbi:MAG: histidine--tRNA ligase [Chloroflexota bacterium]|nr:MAG: histidine--tRNA ligase [Chloroflexota bacterium]